MGVFEELSAPVKFNRLRKYFQDLELEDLEPTLPYENLVADVDKLMMAIFCRKYLNTENDQDSDDDDEPLLQLVWKAMVKDKEAELAKVYEELGETKNELHTLKRAMQRKNEEKP